VQLDTKGFGVGGTDLSYGQAAELFLFQEIQDKVIVFSGVIPDSQLLRNVAFHQLRNGNRAGRVAYAFVKVKLDLFLLFAQLIQGVGIDTAPLTFYIGISIHITAVLAVGFPITQNTPLVIFALFRHFYMLLSRKASDMVC
jgi:hypothetical protein